MKIGRHKVVGSVSFEPMTVTVARQHLRNEDQSADDAVITGKITTARLAAEAFINQPICTRTFADYHYDFPDYIKLYYGNVSAVSSIQYYDGANALQTLSSANYYVDNVQGRAIIGLNEGYTWPDVYPNRYNGVVINYSAGYTTTGAIPEDLIDGMKLVLGTLYEGREDVGGRKSMMLTRAQALWHPYRLYDE